MPVIQVTLMEGYDAATQKLVMERITDAIRATIYAPLDAITVQIDEVKPTGYMRGRTYRTPGAAQPRAGELVLSFLAAMEGRDIDKARAMLGEGFTMIFPGPVRYTRLEEFAARAGTRYKTVTKTFEAVDEHVMGEDTIVVCRGTLTGVWLDGRAFSGIRFIDRFVVRGGKLVHQEVWNDLGEVQFAETKRG